MSDKAKRILCRITNSVVIAGVIILLIGLYYSIIKAGIPYQKFVNRSDVRGGSTLGAILSSVLPVRTVDVGAPILAMHSAVETMAAADMEALAGLVAAYFEV